MVGGEYGIWSLPWIFNSTGFYETGGNAILFTELPAKYLGGLLTVLSCSLAGDLMSIDWDYDRLADFDLGTTGHVE
eukprot:10117922-Ditylum_brightwellii.AAC.1